MKVEVIDNSAQVLKDFKYQMEKAAFEIGMTAEAYAAIDCPVDTGRLRASITHAEKQETDGLNVYIGTNVEYAPVVEFDDSKKHKGGTKAHFLRDAATTHNDEYKQIAEDYLTK